MPTFLKSYILILSTIQNWGLLPLKYNIRSPKKIFIIINLKNVYVETKVFQKLNLSKNDFNKCAPKQLFLIEK